MRTTRAIGTIVALGTLLAALHVVEAAPPRLVRAEPAHGAKDVAVDVGVLRLIFDQDMSPDSWTFWASSQGNMPPMEEIQGSPWRGARTLEVKLKRLEPGATYAVQLNSEARQGFRTTLGEALAPTVVVFRTAGAAAGVAKTLEYHHPSRRFTLVYPDDWRLIRNVEDGEAIYAVTPQLDKARVDDMEVGLSIHLLPNDRTSPVRRKDAVTRLRHLKPVVWQAIPEMKLVGEPAPAEMGGMSGARMRFQGKAPNRPQPSVAECFAAFDGSYTYMVLVLAPEKDWERYEPVFGRILANSRLGRLPATRRGVEARSDRVAEMYKESVVSVLAFGEEGGGSGTGFVIHPDGYVATNAHVVLDDLAAQKPAKRWTVEWDETLGRKSLDAQLVGWKFQMTPGAVHGVDVALLKLPPGRYKSMPLTMLDDVKLGDEIVTMGFPKRTEFTTLNMFVTAGVVTRFNRDQRGETQSIFHDAKTTHGSSGGPAVSLATSGVIGLTSFGHDIASPEMQKQNPEMARTTNDLVGYNGIVPTDLLVRAFPLVADMGLSPDTEFDFVDGFSLAQMLMSQGSLEEAKRLIERAVARNPQSADALALKAGIALQMASSPKEHREAMQAFEDVLAADPNHQMTLQTLAQQYLNSKDYLKASLYADRVVEAHPKSWMSWYSRANMLVYLKKYEEAAEDVARAKELSGGRAPEPFILAGDICYAQKDQKDKLKEGRAEYAKAAQIQPTNLMARLGVGFYYELSGNHEAALVEYGRVANEFPKEPFVLSRVARCYKGMGEYDKALSEYNASADLSIQLSEIPTEQVFMDMAQILGEIKRSPTEASRILGRYFVFHGGSPNAWKAYAMVGTWMRDTNKPGVAFGFFSRARSLKPDSVDIRRDLEKSQIKAMSVKDIQHLLQKMQYPSSVVAGIVACTPLTFTITDRKDIEAAQKLGFPGEVILAILKSNKELGAGDEPQAGGGQQGDQPGVQQPGAAGPQPGAQQPGGQLPGGVSGSMPGQTGWGAVDPKLVGVWQGKLSVFVPGMGSVPTDLTITYTSGGRYSQVLASAAAFPENGAWQAKDGSISMTRDGGPVAVYQYQVQGNTMRLLGINEVFGGSVTLQKVGPAQ